MTSTRPGVGNFTWPQMGNFNWPWTNGGGRVDSKPLRVNEGMRRHSRPSSR